MQLEESTSHGIRGPSPYLIERLRCFSTFSSIFFFLVMSWKNKNNRLINFPNVCLLFFFSFWSDWLLLSLTAWWRVQSGPEWRPDDLEAPTVRQTSAAATQLCSPGELRSLPGGVSVIPETLQHSGSCGCSGFLQTTSRGRLRSRRTSESGEVEINILSLEELKMRIMHSECLTNPAIESRDQLRALRNYEVRGRHKVNTFLLYVIESNCV